MVAPRSLPEPPVVAPVTVARLPSTDPVADLAAKWATLASHADAGTAARLATVLRRLAGTLKGEPFWPLAVRELGADVLDSGLCGEPGHLRRSAEDVLPATLGLLRREAPAALGTFGAEGDRRLAAALDELATGFARGLRDRTRREHEDMLRRGTDRAPAVGETEHRAVYAQSAVGIGIAGLDGRILDLNPALCRMFGLSSPLDQPRPITDFVHPDDAADLIDRYQRVVHGEPDVLRMDLRFIRPDGLVVWTHLVASLARDVEGAPTHLIAVVEDVSAQLPAALPAQAGVLPGPADPVAEPFPDGAVGAALVRAG